MSKRKRAGEEEEQSSSSESDNDSSSSSSSSSEDSSSSSDSENEGSKADKTKTKTTTATKKKTTTTKKKKKNAESKKTSRKRSEEAREKKKPLDKDSTYDNVLKTYFLEELKDFARFNDLKVSGTKSDLVKRIIAFFNPDDATAVLAAAEADRSKSSRGSTDAFMSMNHRSGACDPYTMSAEAPLGTMLQMINEKAREKDDPICPKGEPHMVIMTPSGYVTMSAIYNNLISKIIANCNDLVKRSESKVIDRSVVKTALRFCSTEELFAEIVKLPSMTPATGSTQ
jgi:hypothetical protein